MTNTDQLSPDAPVTVGILNQLLDEKLRHFPTKEEFTVELNDRFEHWDKKNEQRHQAMLAEMREISHRIDRSDEFDHLTNYLSKHLKVPVAELVGRA